MRALTTAVREQRWDLAALCLMVALLEAVREVSAQGLTGVLEVLEGEAYEHGA